MYKGELIKHIVRKWIDKQCKLEHKPRCVYLDIDKREKEDYDARMLLKEEQSLVGGDLNIIAIDPKGKNILNKEKEYWEQK